MMSPNPILPPHRQFARLWLMTHKIPLSAVAAELGVSRSYLKMGLERIGVPHPPLPLFHAMVKLSGLSEQAVIASLRGMLDSADSTN